MSSTFNSALFKLPGFRFHPTEEELLSFYLERKVAGKLNVPSTLILDVDFYNYDPWELSGMQSRQHNYYFFFVPRDRKHPNGSRPNRITPRGYWKATGSDHQIKSSYTKLEIGLKKTLVFYEGRAPRGRRTSWVINEFRLRRTDVANTNIPKECDVTLCRMYKKSSSSSSSPRSFGLTLSSSPEMLAAAESASLAQAQGSASTSSSSSTALIPAAATATAVAAVNVEARQETSASSHQISGYDDYSAASLEHFFHNVEENPEYLLWLDNDEVQSRMNMNMVPLAVPQRDAGSAWQLQSPNLILTPTSTTAMFQGP